MVKSASFYIVLLYIMISMNIT